MSELVRNRRVFALFQLSNLRKRRRSQVAAEKFSMDWVLEFIVLQGLRGLSVVVKGVCS